MPSCPTPVSGLRQDIPATLFSFQLFQEICVVTGLKPNVTERIGPDESCKICLPAHFSPHATSMSRELPDPAALSPAPHLHEHVPVHVPRRQEVTGRMERKPAGRCFQHDVFRGVSDADRGFRGVGVLLVAPILGGPLLTRAVHAPKGSSCSTVAR